MSLSKVGWTLHTKSSEEVTRWRNKLQTHHFLKYTNYANFLLTDRITSISAGHILSESVHIARPLSHLSLAVIFEWTVVLIRWDSALQRRYIRGALFCAIIEKTLIFFFCDRAGSFFCFAFLTLFFPLHRLNGLIMALNRIIAEYNRSA